MSWTTWIRTKPSLTQLWNITCEIKFGVGISRVSSYVLHFCWYFNHIHTCISYKMEIILAFTIPFCLPPFYLHTSPFNSFFEIISKFSQMLICQKYYSFRISFQLKARQIFAIGLGILYSLFKKYSTIYHCQWFKRDSDEKNNKWKLHSEFVQRILWNWGNKNQNHHKSGKVKASC